MIISQGQSSAEQTRPSCNIHVERFDDDAYFEPYDQYQSVLKWPKPQEHSCNNEDNNATSTRHSCSRLGKLTWVAYSPKSACLTATSFRLISGEGKVHLPCTNTGRWGVLEAGRDVGRPPDEGGLHRTAAPNSCECHLCGDRA